MRGLACLVVLAVSAMPCVASEPVNGRTATKRKSRLAEVLVAPPPPLYFEPAPLLSGDLVRTILFPDRELAGWVADQLRPRPRDVMVIGGRVFVR
jgi:hypothetical protein